MAGQRLGAALLHLHAGRRQEPGRAERDRIAWNQTWHVPTAPDPPTGREFIALAAQAFGVPPRHRVLNRPMLKVAGWFDKTIAESYEMLYQSDSEYLFDSTKFAEGVPV